jgi:hypothetical protein
MSTDTVQTDAPVVINQNVDTNSDATEALIEALPYVVEESKKGYKSTEFWVAIVLTGLTVLDGIPLPEKYEGVVAGAIGLAYIISRGIAKQGQPNVVPAPPVDTPPSA